MNLLASIQPGIAVSKLMQYIKRESSRKILIEFENFRKSYCGQNILARGVTIDNLNEQQVQKYIENQDLPHKQDNFSISEHCALQEFTRFASKEATALRR